MEIFHPRGIALYPGEVGLRGLGGNDNGRGIKVKFLVEHSDCGLG
jgi:hypothetical protein